MPVLEAALTPTEWDAFARNGYHIARGLFSPEEIAEIRDGFMAMNAGGPVPGLSETHYGEQAYDAADPLSFYPRMIHPHLHPEMPVGPLAMRYMLSPKLYPVLRQLCEAEPLAMQSMFYFKPPGARGQELHQDNYYLRVSPGSCMAAWVAVDDADAENGGMKIVPGSHRQEVACPQQADSRVSFTSDYVPVPEGLEAVPVTLKAGDVLFFNGSVIHGSTPNTSPDRFRRAFICHYAPGFAEEKSPFYQAYRFDGTEVSLAEATGGGPCGTAQPMAIH